MPVIFAGRVTAITAIPRTDDRGPISRVRFAVLEPLRGTTARQIDLFTYGTSCDLSFEVGEAWLIYAGPRWDGPGLVTGTCSRSQPLHLAVEDLQFAHRAFRDLSGKARLFGSFGYSVRPGTDAPLGFRPVSGAVITAQGEWGTPTNSLTDAHGRFDIAVDPGRYRISVALPPGMTEIDTERFVDVPAGASCASVDFEADYFGSVSGTVVDKVGRPVAKLAVEVMPVQPFASEAKRVQTDVKGQFHLSQLTPGEYVAGIVIGSESNEGARGPRYYFAGSTTERVRASRITVDGGQTKRIGTVRLSSELTVTTIVGDVRKGSRPVAGAKVRMKADFDDSDFPWTTIAADGRGRFAFTVVSGIAYRIVAEAGDASVRVVVNSRNEAAPLHLILH